MGKTPVKGVDSLIQAQRPVLRALIYGCIALMSILQLALTGVSWTNIEFMRHSGDFTGALSVVSGIITFGISTIYAVTTILTERAENDHEQVPLFCERFNRPSVERLISCIMASWWFAISISNANMMYVFRDEITKCVRGQDKNSSPDACKVLRGAVSLSWLILLMWIIRAWRGFTRDNMHFDSRIFAEAFDDHEFLTYPSPRSDSNARPQSLKQSTVACNLPKKMGNGSMSFEVVGSLPPLPQKFLGSLPSMQKAGLQQSVVNETAPAHTTSQNANGQTPIHAHSTPHPNQTAPQPPNPQQSPSHEAPKLTHDTPVQQQQQQQQQSLVYIPAPSHHTTQPVHVGTVHMSNPVQPVLKNPSASPAVANARHQKVSEPHIVNNARVQDNMPAFETNGTARTVGTIHPQFRSMPITGVTRHPRQPQPLRPAPPSSTLQQQMHQVQPVFPAYGQGV